MSTPTRNLSRSSYSKSQSVRDQTVNMVEQELPTFIQNQTWEMGAWAETYNQEEAVKRWMNSEAGRAQIQERLDEEFARRQARAEELQVRINDESLSKEERSNAEEELKRVQRAPDQREIARIAYDQFGVAAQQPDFVETLQALKVPTVQQTPPSQAVQSALANKGVMMQTGTGAFNIQSRQDRRDLRNRLERMKSGDLPPDQSFYEALSRQYPGKSPEEAIDAAISDLNKAEVGGRVQEFSADLAPLAYNLARLTTANRSLRELDQPLTRPNDPRGPEMSQARARRIGQLDRAAAQGMTTQERNIATDTENRAFTTGMRQLREVSDAGNIQAGVNDLYQRRMQGARQADAQAAQQRRGFGAQLDRQIGQQQAQRNRMQQFDERLARRDYNEYLQNERARARAVTNQKNNRWGALRGLAGVGNNAVQRFRQSDAFDVPYSRLYTDGSYLRGGQMSESVRERLFRQAAERNGLDPGAQQAPPPAGGPPRDSVQFQPVQETATQPPPIPPERSSVEMRPMVETEQQAPNVNLDQSQAAKDFRQVGAPVKSVPSMQMQFAPTQPQFDEYPINPTLNQQMGVGQGQQNPPSNQSNLPSRLTRQPYILGSGPSGPNAITNLPMILNRENQLPLNDPRMRFFLNQEYPTNPYSPTGQ